jgi:cell division protein FtsI/penicillin-binding protein 2
VFKVLTVAAALDAGVVTPETTYYDPGWIEVGGAVIRNSSWDLQGQYSVPDILLYSLNVGVAWLTQRMGAETFYRYVNGFGIGQKTGVDLEGEVAGVVWTPQDYAYWHDANLGTNAFGQGLAVTPLQMISAVAAVANDGVRLQPHIVSRRVDSDGKVFTHPSLVEARVISTETAQAVTAMMVRAVQEGPRQTQVEGYRVAGKSGTAQIPVPGGYDPQATIASFVGFGPIPDPQVIVLVKLDRPRTSQWAADTAAPTFSRVMARLFILLRIPPQDADVAQAVLR